MLVVVEDGYSQVLEAFFNFETAGRGNVLEVDAAEAGGQVADRLDDGSIVLGAKADGESVHVGKALEENGLAFHHRQGRLGADVAQAQNGGTVGYHCHGVAPVGQGVAFRLVFVNGQAYRGDAGSVGNGKLLHRLHLHLGGDTYLTPTGAMAIDCFHSVVHHISLPT